MRSADATEPAPQRGDQELRTTLVVDGEPEDAVAITEAARAVEGLGARLLVLLVPVKVSAWAHLEFGDDPVLVRQEIEWEQWRDTTSMLEAAGVVQGYRMQHLRTRWGVSELNTSLDGCETLIVSTSSRVVRRRLESLARRGRIRLRSFH